MNKVDLYLKPDYSSILNFDCFATSMSDPYNLQRFLDAQAPCYPQALAEIAAGQKTTHWMWFIFPQYHGLGFSPASQHYAIKSIAEARAYLDQAVLGSRLNECVSALLAIEGRSAHQIFGSPDHLKLKSSATLFAEISPPGSGFSQILDQYFNAHPDPVTLDLIRDADRV